MRSFVAFFVLLVTLSLIFCSWGFYGHRQINKYAVYTLPSELMHFFKEHIQYISEHAVDPDKRRYATKYEAQRHYIDIDHWGEAPFDEVPRQFHRALAKYSDLVAVNSLGDTLIFSYEDQEELDGRIYWGDVESAIISIRSSTYDSLFRTVVIPMYYEDQWDISAQKELFDWKVSEDIEQLMVKDRFSEYGILPYHLLRYYHRIVRAFEDKNTDRILQLCADMGHYIGDAHVPLHTTENYNGRMTDQVGIHAFWESRIPELMAEEEYDFFVGKASYIQDPQAYFWDIVLTSHSLVDSVLLIEKRVRARMPQEEIYCYEERLERVVRTQCEAFAREYAMEMKGMVEKRMRESVQSIGSVWFSAWVDAGQPSLEGMFISPSMANKDDFRPASNKPLGRAHESE